jgi:Lar family restriction alleviation protein
MSDIDLTPEAVELKPCPFCGGKAEFYLVQTGDGKDWHYLECAQCEAMGPRAKYSDHGIAIKNALAVAWNTRATPATLRALSERLAETQADLNAERAVRVIMKAALATARADALREAADICLGKSPMSEDTVKGLTAAQHMNNLVTVTRSRAFHDAAYSILALIPKEKPHDH